MSIFHHKTQFTSEQLACAIVGVTSWKENRDEVSLWTEEIDLAFPPEVYQKRFSNYGGGERVVEEKKYPAIPREQALAFCEQRGIRPPLLFPDDPPNSLTPADSSQSQETSKKDKDKSKSYKSELLTMEDLALENARNKARKEASFRQFIVALDGLKDEEYLVIIEASLERGVTWIDAETGEKETISVGGMRTRFTKAKKRNPYIHK